MTDSDLKADEQEEAQSPSRGVSGGWAGWAIAHPDFGRIEGAAGRRRHATTRHITTCPPSVW